MTLIQPIQQLKLGETTTVALDQPQQKQSQAALLLANYASVVQGAVHHQLGASLGSRGLGASQFPLPSLPPSDCPYDPFSLPSDQPHTRDGSGYIDRLKDFIDWVDNNPQDATARLYLMAYIGTLSQAGKINGEVIDLLDDKDGSTGINIIQLISLSLGEGMAYAFFRGYNGQTGQAGAAAWLADTEAFLNGLGGKGNEFSHDMLNSIAGYITILPQFAIDHKDGVWDFGNVTYNWNDPGDQYYIDQIIANEGVDSYFDGFSLSKFLRQWRLQALGDLLRIFKNPEIAISLWLVQAYDNQFQGEEGGLADTTSTLTQLTNNVATPLLTYAKKFGQINANDAQAFVKLLFNGTNLINLFYQTDTIADNWNTNVVQVFANTSVTFTDSQGNQVTDNLLNVMTQGTDPKTGKPYTPGDIAAALNSLNPAPGGASSVPIPGYQAIVNAMEQAGALVTGISKTTATQSSTVANVDGEVIKLGHSFVDPTGGGLVQMMNQIVQNFISR